MTPQEKYERLTELFHTAKGMTPEKRQSFLNALSPNDASLRIELQSLLAVQSVAISTDPPDDIAAGYLAQQGRSFNDAPSLELNTRFDHYEIRSLLGKGGMGEVYLAEDLQLCRKVALKILPRAVAANQDRMRRFVQEAKAASALNHPNIITIHEINQTDSGYFIATEFVDGQTLHEHMHTAPMKLSKVLNVTAQIASALVAAHDAGIVHRDIKPENVMLRPDGIVKVLDFGLAKLTERLPSDSLDPEAPTSGFLITDPGIVMGTASYMSPEQARGTAVDARTDIFSLGVVVYEMVAGCTPFAAPTSSEVMASILSEREPQPLARYSRDVPAELERIVSKALRKNRDERYQTIKDLLIDLKDLARELDLEAQLERRATPEFPARVTTQRSESAMSAGAITVGQEDSNQQALDAIGSKQWRKGRRASLKVLTAGAMLMIGAVSLSYLWVRRAQKSAKLTDRSIAVLPFKNLGAATGEEYLGLGLTDALITKLSNIHSLTVRPTSAVLKYGSQGKDTTGAGHELQVETVLDGSVQRVGDRVRVTVQLVRANDGKPLWADTYDAEFRNIFQVQDEISARVAEALKVQLSGGERERLAKQPTENIEAYQLYLRGNYYLYNFTPENLQKAMRYYNEAVARDPLYAVAYAGLANAYGIASSFGDDEASLRAEAAATKAIELDPTLAEAHAALAGTRFWHQRDSRSAQDSFNRALELNPNSAVVHHYYAWFLSATGRFEEAEKHIHRALELDPLSPAINVDQGLPFFFARRFDEARGRYKQALNLDADYWYAHLRLGEADEGLGDFAQAVSEFERATASNGDPTWQAQRARALALAGRKEEARHLLGEIAAKEAPHRGSPYYIALAFAALGERDETFEWLERAFGEKDKWLGWINVDPRLDPLRSDERFSELLRRVRG